MESVKSDLFLSVRLFIAWVLTDVIVLAHQHSMFWNTSTFSLQICVNSRIHAIHEFTSSAFKSQMRSGKFASVALLLTL